MSVLQWVSAYFCVAAVVAGSAIAFATWSRRREPTGPGVVAGPALLAGALWPLIVAGLAEWLLVHAVGTALRRESADARRLVPMDAA